MAVPGLPTETKRNHKIMTTASPETIEAVAKAMHSVIVTEASGDKWHERGGLAKEIWRSKSKKLLKKLEASGFAVVMTGDGK